MATAAQFAPARSLAPEGSFIWASDHAHGWVPGVLPKVVGERQRLVVRTVAALRLRHLQPYAARNFKDVLRACDQYGTDHRTPTGATPLMMAARAGNLPLVDALIERGADVDVVDEFGHSAWLVALNRAMEDAAFAGQSLAPLFDRLAPGALDVQTDRRLVRLEPRQGEYWLFGLMLAGLKTQASRCVERPHPLRKYRQGFFADALHAVLMALPEHLWKAQRRKRSYVNQVLARAEVESAYQPARRLWLRTMNGHYLPNPQLQLRKAAADAESAAWQPVYEALNLAWVDAGTATTGGWSVPNLAEVLASAEAQLVAGTPAPD